MVVVVPGTVPLLLGKGTEGRRDASPQYFGE
jgi:hypothetical protein